MNFSEVTRGNGAYTEEYEAVIIFDKIYYKDGK